MIISSDFNSGLSEKNEWSSQKGFRWSHRHQVGFEFNVSQQEMGCKKCFIDSTLVSANFEESSVHPRVNRASPKWPRWTCFWFFAVHQGNSVFCHQYTVHYLSLRRIPQQKAGISYRSGCTVRSTFVERIASAISYCCSQHRSAGLGKAKVTKRYPSTTFGLPHSVTHTKVS